MDGRLGGGASFRGEEVQLDRVADASGGGLVGLQGAVSGAAALGRSGRGASRAGPDGGADQVVLDVTDLGRQS